MTNAPDANATSAGSDMTNGRAAIIVRRAAIADAAAFARIMSDAEVYPQTLQMPFSDTAQWNEWLGESLAPGKSDLLLVAELDGEVVGTAGLHPVGPRARRRHAMMLGIMVAPAAQRRGVGSALMAALCDYADGWAPVLRIELTVFTDNARAIALYRRFGFEIEGTHRAYALRNGAYADAHFMARLHPRQPTLC